MSNDVTSRNKNEIIESRVPLEDIPLQAIRKKTKDKLSLLLNPEKVLVNEDGYYRDWRGIFTLSGLTQSEYTLISQSQDKTEKLLKLWIDKNKENGTKITLSQLQTCLATIDRYDVHDDVSTFFVEDANFFLSKSQSANTANSSSFEIVQADPDNDIITQQDLECSEKGLPLKTYDAFVIYNDKDVEFASELIERCENLGYSLCVKDRDLLGGLSFESDAILKLLSNRCNRLIIIVSKAFLKSPMQVFITNHAQAFGIEQGERKIVPCLLEPCDLPQMLRFCFRLDYYRNNKLFDFWDKLDKSLKITPKVKSSYSEENRRQTITEIDAASSNLKINIPATPAPLYDKEHVYKFTDTPTPTPSEKAERSSKMFFMKKQSPEAQKQIWPPPPKLRAASSMVALNDCNSDSLKISNKLSQSSFYLNQEISNDSGIEAIKSKRRKWYKMFLPPRDAKVSKMKVVDELSEQKEQKDKRPWYKKKKKEKSTEKVAVAC